ncbi:MAG: ATP-dependent Lon protease, partial [Candidatus Paceibacteria bacterium]
MSKSKLSLLDSLSFQEFQDDAEFIPLMSSEDEEEMNNEDLPEILPILPLRNTVLFPGVIVPITAGRDKSIALIHETNKEGKIIGVVSQKEEGEEDPGIDDINTIGTVAKILKVLKMPDGNTTVIIQGKKRFQVSEVITTEPYITATVRAVEEARPAIDN